MRVRLKGIASAKKKLADGTTQTYFYAWRGGPRLSGDPGSPEFHASYNAAVATRNKPDGRTLFSLIAEFKASSEWAKLGQASKKEYTRYLKLIENEFGSMPVSGLAHPECRGDFMEWRDGFLETPRKADYAWTTLARVLAVAKNRGRISVNPCEKGGRLYDGSRAEQVWDEGQIGLLLAASPSHMELAILLALWTGQRQGDLLRLPWSAYDGGYIRLEQSKSRRGNNPGKKIVIPVGAKLKFALDRTKRVSTLIVTNSYERPWTSDGFRASWRDLRERAGLHDADRTFHDFRGTAVTRLAVAGCEVPEIAAITGHSLKTVADILDKHYLNRDVRLAENAIRKLERNEKRTKIANRLQTGGA